jgi:hypothetical protein
MTQPTVGRIVHYRSYGTPGGEYVPECRAAVVTAAAQKGDLVSLAVLNPTGMFFNNLVEQDEDQARGGTWHWPCVRAEEAAEPSPEPQFQSPVHWGGHPPIQLEHPDGARTTDVPSKVTCPTCRTRMAAVGVLS